MLHKFIESLVDTGHVRMCERNDDSHYNVEKLDAVLGNVDARARLEMAAEAPPLSLLSARWAATTFYSAYRFYTFRDTPPEAIRDRFSAGHPEQSTHTAVYFRMT